MARERSPLAAMPEGRRAVAAGQGRTVAMWPNPIAEWRRENYGSVLQPDVFFTLQIPVDVTGRRIALRRASTLSSLRGIADSSEAWRELDEGVARTFWRASLAEELAEIAAETLEAWNRSATFDAQRFANGAVAEVVALRSRLERDRAQTAATLARNERARARAALATALGIPLSELGILSRPAVDGIATAAVDTSWAAVSARRTDFVGARLAAEAAERRWRAESRGAFGDLQVVGGYKGTGGLATGVLGLLVPLPLFNRNDGPRLQSRGEHVLARAALLDLENRIRAEIDAASQAWSEITAADSAGISTMAQRADEIADIADAAYREGATSLLDLIEAQRARSETRAAAARWAVEVRLTLVALKRATGTPLLEER